jgi:hypothetical protein
MKLYESILRHPAAYSDDVFAVAMPSMSLLRGLYFLSETHLKKAFSSISHVLLGRFKTLANPLSLRKKIKWRIPPTGGHSWNSFHFDTGINRVCLGSAAASSLFFDLSFFISHSSAIAV